MALEVFLSFFYCFAVAEMVLEVPAKTAAAMKALAADSDAYCRFYCFACAMADPASVLGQNADILM